MCTLLFALDSHPDYSLILAANRDEFHARESLKLHWWKPDQQILAGQDCEKGGLWLGLDRCGGLAGVTNFREAHSATGTRSRGIPGREFLRRRMECGDLLDQLSENAQDWSGFNMLLARHEQFWWFSNRLPLELSQPQAIYQRLQAGVYGLSNGGLNSNWPKVQAGRKALQALIQNKKISRDSLFSLLADRHIYPDSELPQTGVSLEKERFLSALFIIGETYGTRCSTVILCDRQGNWQVEERRFSPEGTCITTVVEEFCEHRR